MELFSTKTHAVTLIEYRLYLLFMVFPYLAPCSMQVFNRVQHTEAGAHARVRWGLPQYHALRDFARTGRIHHFYPPLPACLEQCVGWISKMK